MSKKAKSLLPKFEILIILILLLSFIIWAFSKCSSRSSLVEQRDNISQQADASLQPQELPSVVDTQTVVTNTQIDSSQIAQPTTPRTIEKVVEVVLPRLYVTIDNLKMRTEPGLKSETVTRLPLFEEVFYLDEFTDSLYIVNLGYETTEEPFIKVKNQKGEIGWVYGAGVDYRKKKRTGVME